MNWWVDRSMLQALLGSADENNCLAVFCKKDVLEISQNSQKNDCAGVSFSLYLKGDFGTSVFLLTLRSF